MAKLYQNLLQSRIALPKEPDELLDHQDTNEEIDNGSTEPTEPNRKKGNGKTKDAAFKLDQLYNLAGTLVEFDL